MVTIGMDLVARAKKLHEVDSLAHENVQAIGELLQRIRTFLKAHETASKNDCTHSVIDNFQDWWMDGRSTCKLAIAEDNTVEQLYSMISALCDLGIPLTLAETRSPQMRFIQEVEIWGNQQEAVGVSELFDCQAAFIFLLAKIMGAIFPKQQVLDCAVFGATGRSRRKGIQQTSVRLAWQNVVVDRHRAEMIRDYVVHKFKNSEDEGIKAFSMRVQGYNQDNQWHNMFSDAIYSGPLGVRMPLCDCVSPAPIKKPEHRPSTPRAIVRCTYQQGELHSLRQHCDRTAHPANMWLQMGCIRRDIGDVLTEWTPPVWTGSAQGRTCVSGNHHGHEGTRQPAPIRIRTVCGSDSAHPAKPCDSRTTILHIEGRSLKTVHREFAGTLADFRFQIEKAMGGQQGANFQETSESLVWQQPGDTGRIEMKACNRRVCITGTDHQLRSLCIVLAPFVLEHPARSDATGSLATVCTQNKVGSVLGSGYGREPSLVFAPSMVYAPPSTVINKGITLHDNMAVGKNMHAGAVDRMANHAFAAEHSDELELSEGDLVSITDDPEQTQASVCRWVCGTNTRTQKCGWFPLNYTSSAMREA